MNWDRWTEKQKNKQYSGCGSTMLPSPITPDLSQDLRKLPFPHWVPRKSTFLCPKISWLPRLPGWLSNRTFFAAWNVVQSPRLKKRPKDFLERRFVFFVKHIGVATWGQLGLLKIFWNYVVVYMCLKIWGLWNAPWFPTSETRQRVFAVAVTWWQPSFFQTLPYKQDQPTNLDFMITISKKNW